MNARPMMTMAIFLDELRQMDDGDDGVLLGTAYLLSIPFHVQAARVFVDDNNHGRQTGDTPLAERMVEDLAQFDDAAEPFCTLQLPGREGDWVVWIVPHCD